MKQSLFTRLPEIRIRNTFKSWNDSFPGRDVFLKIREWELDSMKALVSELERHMQAGVQHCVFSIRFRFRDWGKSLICFRSRKNKF